MPSSILFQNVTVIHTMLHGKMYMTWQLFLQFHCLYQKAMEDWDGSIKKEYKLPASAIITNVIKDFKTHFKRTNLGIKALTKNTFFNCDVQQL